jgi:EPS-associated MarR family transcriptional regulator
MLSEQDFLILDAIDRRQSSSQRSLARHSGMSLGKTNYVLKKLVKKGLVKISNFKVNPSKNQYLYILTPRGIEAKARLTVSFIQARMREFEEVRHRLLDNLLNLQGQGVRSLLVISSSTLAKFIADIARTENLDIQVVGTVSDTDDLGSISPDSYDCVLVADDPDHYNDHLQTHNIPSDKIVYLQ